MRLLYTLILTSLLATPAGVLGQSSSEEKPEQGAATQDSPTAKTPDPEPPEENDPFDYEASEEISKDLSVSFPVDI
jgi:hypothetical protein